MIKVFGVLSILIGVISVFMSIAGVESIRVDGFSEVTVFKNTGLVENIVSILISVALIVGGYGILKKAVWAYWYVLVVMVTVVLVLVVQGVYIVLTFESLPGRLWGLISQWLIAWIIYKYIIRGYWPKKKPLFEAGQTLRKSQKKKS